jgi:hypothetical protein
MKIRLRLYACREGSSLKENAPTEYRHAFYVQYNFCLKVEQQFRPKIWNTFTAPFYLR